MIESYTFEDAGMDIQKHPVKHTVEQVRTGLAYAGYNGDASRLMTPKDGSKLAKGDYLITPKFSEGLRDTLENINWLSIGEVISGHFGQVKGAKEMTSIFANGDMSISDMVLKLSETDYDMVEDDDLPDSFNDMDMLQALIVTIKMSKTDSDPESTIDILAYDLVSKSLGWLAERFLSRIDDFQKAQASLDSHGIDLIAQEESEFRNGEFHGDIHGYQLKTIQRIASDGTGSIEGKQHPHLGYGWLSDGMVVGDMDDIKGTDNVAKAMQNDAGTGSKTIMKKSSSYGETKDYHRDARVVAW